MTIRHSAPAIGAIILLTAIRQLSAGADGAGAQAAQGFIAANRLDERWQGDPLRQLDSAELRAAYPRQEFYFTFKAPPLPPGAPMPELIEKHKAAMAEYKKHSLRMTMGVDAAQNVAAFQSAADFNHGLMPVKNENDAKIAAAAILSLIGNDDVYPEIVGADKITVTAGPSGWTCALKQARGFDGTVVFGVNGSVVSAAKTLNYVPPLPS